MKITLLTHFKEFPKKSNTGRLVLDILGSSAEQVRWDRTTPPAALLKEIEVGDVALIYPGASDEPEIDLSDVRQFIIIDGTWHEARKIHQRSNYLQGVRRISLKTVHKSRYNLRKNQKESGLCTAECVIEILRRTGNNTLADQLEEHFMANMRPARKAQEENPSAHYP